MDNPTEGNYYQPYRPEDPAPAPPPRYYDGSQNFATLSLVMGILALVSLCCFPFISIPFAGLGILFSCLSKGKFSRPGPAKAGMAISTALLAILLTLGILVSVMVFSSPMGRSFFQDYMDLLTSDTITEQELYDFIEKYTGGISDYGSDSYSQPDIMTTAMMPMMIFLKTITIILTAVTVIQDILTPMETTSLSTRNQTPEQGTIIFKGFLSPRRFLQSFL